MSEVRRSFFIEAESKEEAEEKAQELANNYAKLLGEEMGRSMEFEITVQQVEDGT